VAQTWNQTVDLSLD